MMYEDVILDFCKRTLANLEKVGAHNASSIDSTQKFYETTHLINSLLGMLVFPQQEMFAKIPRTSLEELVKQGWPRIKHKGDQPPNNLHDLARYLRNSIAHFNVKFTSDHGQISGITLWNEIVEAENTQINLTLMLPGDPKGSITPDLIKVSKLNFTPNGKRKNQTNWEVELKIEELKVIAIKFTELMINNYSVHLNPAENE